jgi:hypothetical protein
MMGMSGLKDTVDTKRDYVTAEVLALTMSFSESKTGSVGMTDKFD